MQRTFVGVDAFKVFQEVALAGPSPRVNNVVEFGANIGFLRVRRLAETAYSNGCGSTQPDATLALFAKCRSRPRRA
jgi:hypothetical protein